MFQVVNAHTALNKADIAKQITVQRRIGFYASNRQFVHCHAHFGDGLVAVFAVNADFANQAVVIGWNAIALINMAIHPQVNGKIQFCQGLG